MRLSALRLNGLKARAALIAACLLSFQADAFADGTATLIQGKTTPLCEALQDLLNATLKSNKGKLCTLPIDDAIGLRPLIWTTMDPSKELNLVKLIFAWNALRQPKFRSQTYLSDMRDSDFLSPSAVEENWVARSATSQS
jgi:hypothetical protein